MYDGKDLVHVGDYAISVYPVQSIRRLHATSISVYQAAARHLYFSLPSSVYEAAARHLYFSLPSSVYQAAARHLSSDRYDTISSSSVARWILQPVTGDW